MSAGTFAWSIDGVCDNTMEAERVLIDYTSLSANVTADDMETALWFENSPLCSNVTFVNSTGVGITIDYQCLMDIDGGEYFVFNNNATWIECEAIDWNTSINPVCDYNNQLELTLNETDWKNYDFIVWETEGMSPLWSSWISKIGVRGHNIYGYTNTWEDKWWYEDPSTQLRFYRSYYRGFFNDTTGYLYSPLGRNETGATNSLVNNTHHGQSGFRFMNYSEWYNLTKDLNLLQGRLHIDPNQVETAFNYHQWNESTTYSFILKKMKLVREENKYDSIDCAVPLSIEEITKNPYSYGGWIVNLTVSRVPTNFEVLDYANDYYETFYQPYGYSRLNRIITHIVADTDSYALRVTDYYDDVAQEFANVDMWDEIYLVGRIGAPHVLDLIYDITKTGNNVRIPYDEEITDLWDYMSTDVDSGYSYFLRSNITDYGCKFVKARLVKEDYFIYDFGADSNAGMGYIFSNEDLCSSGFGCEISWEIPYSADYPASNEYDMIMIGQLCKETPTTYHFHPSGLAWDEQGLQGDGICQLPFEEDSGVYGEYVCKISPTFFTIWQWKQENTWYTVLVGIIIVMALVGFVLWSLWSVKQQNISIEAVISILIIILAVVMILGILSNDSGALIP